MWLSYWCKGQLTCLKFRFWQGFSVLSSQINLCPVLCSNNFFFIVITVVTTSAFTSGATVAIVSQINSLLL